MRIGTWNLEGCWGARHLTLIEAMNCDVLLLTEVREDIAIPSYDLHLGHLEMVPGRRWAAVASRLPMHPLHDPHGASAMADVDGQRYCSSVLPRRNCGQDHPWSGADTTEKTLAAVADVRAAVPTVWGGDWNHAFSGGERSGSLDGRAALLDAVARLGLQVPTADASHQKGGLSIDHIAVPRSWDVSAVERHRALVDERWISDHDAYVVTVLGPATTAGERVAAHSSSRHAPGSANGSSRTPSAVAP